MSGERAIVVGGGAAGFFAAIACAESAPGLAVTLIEKAPEFLGKVRISGGGRCNVTHACFEPRELVTSYARGARELLGPFHRFQPRDTVAWFEARGVPLKTEADGRMFPVSDSSRSIVDCLVAAARGAGVELRARTEVAAVTRRERDGCFLVELADGGVLPCDRLLLATGGCRGPAAGRVAESLGHTLIAPVPSLFTFTIESAWLRALAGVTVPEADLWVPGSDLRQRGPVLVTHWGLSGPAILRLSAWGARELARRDYQFPLRLNWLPGRTPAELEAEFERQRQEKGARRISNTPLAPVPARLWECLVRDAGISREHSWSALTRSGRMALVAQLTATEFQVCGKSLNKEEFVTCGGVRLSEVNFKTMESRVCPGLFLAGEVLDIDGVTGGFNFQSAWTTGWLAGRAMAPAPPR